MEECYEQFLTRDYGNRQEYLNGTANGLLFLSAVMTFGLRSLPMAVLTGVGYVGLVLYMRSKYVEYEYELVCDELTVSKIFNKRRRKKIVNIELKNMIEVDKNANHKIKDLYIDAKGLEKKVIYVRENNQVKGYRIALDKKLLAKCRRVNPRMFSDF
ncbi:MAG: hypothetical protein ACRCWM_03890 [Sarcina sp.]